MTIERPMFPPRAESVNSFSSQPAVGQHGSRTPTGGLGSPPEGCPADRRSQVSLYCPQLFRPVHLRSSDPVFAPIAAKMAADAAHGEAIDVYDTFESAGDYSSEAALEADAMCEAACDCAMDVAWQLAITAPTTLGGVEAVLRFAKPRRLQREHGKWPSSGPQVAPRICGRLSCRPNARRNGLP